MGKVISIEKLRESAIKALINKGASEYEAKIVTEDYIDAELRGRKSHGFSAFKIALGAFPHSGKFEVENELASIILVNGHGAPGHTIAREAIDYAIEKIDKTGSFTIGIKNITRFNTPGSIARYAANKGFISLVFEYGGKNFMTAYGGKEAALSTNPIGIGIPYTDPLFILDIATSEKAIGYVYLAQGKGETIPSSWGVNESGLPESDPEKVKAVVPFGGYKGYGLALAIEILTGCLLGVPVGKQGELSNRGALIFLINPENFGQAKDELSSTITSFLQEIINSAPINADAKVLYPGQGGEKRYQEALKEGMINLPLEVLNLF